MSNDHPNPGQGGPDEVEVHFKDIPEVEQTTFKTPGTNTLQAAWNEAYVKMSLSPGQNDMLQTHGSNPKSLKQFLGLTLQALKAQKIVDAFNFEIVAETGGA